MGLRLVAQSAYDIKFDLYTMTVFSCRAIRDSSHGATVLTREVDVTRRHLDPSRRSGYVRRRIDARLRAELDTWPAVVISGPRGVGKTTTALRVIESAIDLSQPQERSVFMLDPEAALRAARKPVLLDEWQQVPDVLWVVKKLIDQDSMRGFVIAGSSRIRPNDRDGSYQWPLVHRGVTLEMHPLTAAEKRGNAHYSFTDGIAGIRAVSAPAGVPGLFDYIDIALEGGYPAYLSVEDPSRRRAQMESALRDIVRLDAASGRIDHRKMLDFLYVYAANSSEMITQTTLAERAGVSRTSAEKYEHALHNSYLVSQLPAWHRTISSRSGKRSKRFVNDAGMWAAMLGVGPKDVRRDSKLVGNLIETFVVSQLRAERDASGLDYDLYHYRDQAKREIDLLLENRRDRSVVAVEVKASSTVTRRDARHLEWLRDELDADTRSWFPVFDRGVILYSGPAVVEISDRVWAAPISLLWEWG